MYGEMSYLSSRTPIIRAIKPAKKSADKVFVKGRKNIVVKKMPTKKGIPPPRGVIVLWIIPGCLRVFGLSNSPIFLIKTKDIGCNDYRYEKRNY